MKLYFKHLKNIILFTLFFNCFHTIGQNLKSDSTKYYTKSVNSAIYQSKLTPERSYKKLKNGVDYFIKKKDTNLVVKCLTRMGEIQKTKGKYSLAFDHLWEAQYLADLSKNKERKVLVKLELAKLYDTFSIYNEALNLLNEALKTSKNLYSKNKKHKNLLISSYVDIAIQYRKIKEYTTALKYLDSCSILFPTSTELPFWEAERGYILLKQKKYVEAESLLHSALNKIKNKNVNYKPNINLQLGELKTEINQPDSALIYFNKTLQQLKKNKIKRDLKAKVFLNISKAKFIKKRAIESYKFLLKYTKIKDSTTLLINKTNGELFELKNTYLKSISRKNSQLKKQETIIQKNEQIQFIFKIILGLITLLIVVIFIVVRTKLKLRKTIIEKKEFELDKKLLEEKSNAEIELKSKELTSYALQLIDKESAIAELLKTIKEESPSTYKSLNYKYKKGSDDLWNEFNLRFTKVNSSFYDRIKAKHPNLSVTELKHCALIKLKFGTKEMARILNIETHSVHISRSRIRKKFGLIRSESLENYIANL